jgi:hypothetical protein
MAAILIANRFYKFEKERIVSRPGAILATAPGIEIGPEISREQALRLVRAGRDVYTMRAQDAKQLAKSAHPGTPVEENPHDPRRPTRSGREDVYYRHFHPGGVHPGDGPNAPGHVFFGERGERHGEEPR